MNFGGDRQNFLGTSIQSGAFAALAGFAALQAAQVPADGCDTTAVQTAITAAQSGDTVTIPDCSSGVSWSSGVVISGKGITLQGAGAGRIIAMSVGLQSIGTGPKTLSLTGTRGDGALAGQCP